MSEPIPRFDPADQYSNPYDPEGSRYAGMEPDPHGDYVLHTDHVDALTLATQRAEAAEGERAKWYDFAAAAERENVSLGQSFAVTELAWRAEVEQRERAKAERDALRNQLQEIHEREAECCGEDESFDERILSLTIERDALRTVDDAMVERVARKLAERYSTNGTTDEHDAWVLFQTSFRLEARCLIDAALAVQPPSPPNVCRWCERSYDAHLTSTNPAMRGWRFCDHNRLQTYEGQAVQPTTEGL